MRPMIADDRWFGPRRRERGKLTGERVEGAKGAVAPARWLAVGLFFLGGVGALGGCADAGYLLQSASGHLSMLRAAKPVTQWLDDAQTPPDLKARLALAQRIRRFAVTDLGLPDNPSYNQYADLKRRAVVWNVVAAPEFSLKLKTWCFPVTGCIGYRGYFDEAQARALAAELKADGLEVSVYGVPAYSTLGWMNWAGGDPLLNTFINYPEGELARLIFHELAHQVAYARDDTMFNESFATAVERLGGARWLARQGSPAAKAEFEAQVSQRAQFRALTLATRRALADVYQQKMPLAQDGYTQLAIKNRVMENFRNQYAQVKAGWIGAAGTNAARFSGYDAWVANANNASFGAQAAYDELVPDFEALFERINQDAGKQAGDPWPRFYAAVKRLADLPESERRQLLRSGGVSKP
jgi:predicted aminopeptidase